MLFTEDMGVVWSVPLRWPLCLQPPHTVTEATAEPTRPSCPQFPLQLEPRASYWRGRYTSGPTPGAAYSHIKAGYTHCFKKRKKKKRKKKEKLKMGLLEILALYKILIFVGKVSEVTVSMVVCGHPSSAGRQRQRG